MSTQDVKEKGFNTSRINCIHQMEKKCSNQHRSKNLFIFKAIFCFSCVRLYILASLYVNN